MLINSNKYNSSPNVSGVESFESTKSFKQSVNDRFDSVNNKIHSISDDMKEVKEGLNKVFELLGALKLGNSEFDARNHDVSSLADKSLNDVQATDATADEATKFVEKPHFSSYGALTQIEKIDGDSTDKNISLKKKGIFEPKPRFNLGYNIDLDDEKDREIIDHIIKNDYDPKDTRSVKTLLDDINKQMNVPNIINELRKKQKFGSLKRFENKLNPSIESFKNDNNPLNLSLCSVFIAFDHTQLDQIAPQVKITDKLKAAGWLIDIAKIFKLHSISLIICETPLTRLNTIIRNNKWINIITQIFSNMQSVIFSESSNFKDLVDKFIKQYKLKEISISDAMSKFEKTKIYYYLSDNEIDERISNIIRLFTILGKDNDLRYVFYHRNLYLDMKVNCLLTPPDDDASIYTMLINVKDSINYYKEQKHTNINHSSVVTKSYNKNRHDIDSKQFKDNLIYGLNNVLQHDNYKNYQDANSNIKKEIKNHPWYNQLDKKEKSNLKNSMVARLQKNSKGIYLLKYESDSSSEESISDEPYGTNLEYDMSISASSTQPQ